MMSKDGPRAALNTTTLFQPFNPHLRKTTFGCKMCLKSVQFEKNVASNLTDLNNFPSLEAVDGVSEAQLKVGENLG